MFRFRLSQFLFIFAYFNGMKMDTTVDDDMSNVCNFPGVPMFCNCDESDPNEATYVSCFVSKNITIDDPHWDGFRQQRNIKSLVFNPRSDTFLTYVPYKVLRTLHLLEHILFSEAHIRVLTSMSFSNLTTVRSINIESNQIEEIEPRAFAFLPALRKLEMSDNKLSRLTAEVFEGVPKLQQLFLENNRLTHIDDGAFAMLSSLQELDLFYNEILHIRPETFVGLDSLFRLDISRNNLTYLEAYVFRGTPNLRDLELGQNQIRSISEKAFANLPHLLNLRMKDNFLTTLPENVFQGSPNILSLRLTNNLLTTFPKTILMSLNQNTDLGFAIYMKGNPLHCSCELDWVLEYSNKSKNQIFREDLKILECVTAEKGEMNLTQYLSGANCSENPRGVDHRKFTTTEASIGFDNPMSDDDDDDDDYDDDDDNDDFDHDVDRDRDMDHNKDKDHDHDHDVDDEFDTDDHSVNVEDIPDDDDDEDDNEYLDKNYRRHPIPPITTENPKNLRGIKKSDVSLTSKSQPSAADGHEAANVNEVPPDNSSPTSTLSSLVLILCAYMVSR